MVQTMQVHTPGRYAGYANWEGTSAPYKIANIDRAIVRTLYDLRGFDHPLGRVPMSPKLLDATVNNFLFYASRGEDSKCTDAYYVPYDENRPYDECLSMCYRLAACCDDAARESIQFIVQDVVRQHGILIAEIAAGTRPQTKYLDRLTPDHRMGKVLIALATACQFELQLP